MCSGRGDLFPFLDIVMILGKVIVYENTFGGDCGRDDDQRV